MVPEGINVFLTIFLLIEGSGSRRPKNVYYGSRSGSFYHQSKNSKKNSKIPFQIRNTDTKAVEVRVSDPNSFDPDPAF
jgi:hypothetical protein